MYASHSFSWLICFGSSKMALGAQGFGRLPWTSTLLRPFLKAVAGCVSKGWDFFGSQHPKKHLLVKKQTCLFGNSFKTPYLQGRTTPTIVISTQTPKPVGWLFSYVFSRKSLHSERSSCDDGRNLAAKIEGHHKFHTFPSNSRNQDFNPIIHSHQVSYIPMLQVSFLTPTRISQLFQVFFSFPTKKHPWQCHGPSGGPSGPGVDLCITMVGSLKTHGLQQRPRDPVVFLRGFKILASCIRIFSLTI